MASKIYIIVDPSNDHKEKPDFWTIYKGKNQIGNIHWSPGRLPLFEVLDSMDFACSLTVEDISRILEFMKNFPDPVPE